MLHAFSFYSSFFLLLIFLCIYRFLNYIYIFIIIIIYKPRKEKFNASIHTNLVDFIHKFHFVIDFEFEIYDFISFKRQIKKQINKSREI